MISIVIITKLWVLSLETAKSISTTRRSKNRGRFITCNWPGEYWFQLFQKQRVPFRQRKPAYTYIQNHWGEHSCRPTTFRKGTWWIHPWACAVQSHEAHTYHVKVGGDHNTSRQELLWAHLTFFSKSLAETKEKTLWRCSHIQVCPWTSLPHVPLT